MPRCLCCKNKFIARFFNQKYCNVLEECKEAFQEFKKGVKPIPKMSEHTKFQLKLYKLARDKFLLNNPLCQKCKKKPATQVHHKKGRIGDLLTNVKYFMALDEDCHRYIELNPIEAKKKGWSIERLT